MHKCCGEPGKAAILLRIPLFIAAGVCALTMAAHADPVPGSSDQPTATGNSQQWHYQRLIDGKVMDEGDLEVFTDARVKATRPSSDGGTLTFIITGGSYDWDKHKDDPPLFDPQTPHYMTNLRSGGILVALQHQPGEVWKMTRGDVTVTKSVALPQPEHLLEVEGDVDGNAYEDVRMQTGNGSWHTFGSAPFGSAILPDVVYGALGAEPPEAPPEMSGHVFMEVPLPAGMGKLYCIAMKVGAVWIVRIDGKEVARVVCDKVDPDWDFNNKKIN